MTLDWLIAWWNLIFVIPFVMGLLYMGLYITTGITFGEAEVDHDVDADADAEVDADADVDGDADVEADGELDSDVDAEHDKSVPVHAAGGGGSAVGGMLDLLGVGRVPFSVVLMTLLVLWGLIGLITNNLLRPVIGSPWLMLLIALPVAAVGSVAATGTFARLMGRFMPLDETTAEPKRALVGLVGEALYAIDERFGMAVVKDARGERYQVPCRVGSGTNGIEKGRPVLLVHYDKDRDYFLVRDYELAAPRRSASEAAADGEREVPAAPARAESRESSGGV